LGFGQFPNYPSGIEYFLSVGKNGQFACPASAIIGNLWSDGVPRESLIDVFMDMFVEFVLRFVLMEVNQQNKNFFLVGNLIRGILLLLPHDAQK